MKTDQEPINLKKIIFLCLIIFSGIIGYLGFISLISLWVGFENSQQPGFWVPITAGMSLLIAVLWIFARTTNMLLRHMKKKTSLDF